MKLIFCDLNKSLVDKVETLFKEFETNKWNLKLEAIHGDIFETHKKYGGKIVTASNPQFTYGGGLDALIKKNFPNEVINNKEFEITDNLFKTITVDSNLKSSKKIIERALIGVFGYREKQMILSGLGTAIGGLSEDDFIEVLKKVLSANLSYADLRSANLRSANLSYANLSYADLRSANLSYADLRSANLSSANLRFANLSSANLSYANLSSANLSYADLSFANLSYANLSSANLSYADLSFANLSSANLRSANLSSANLRSSKNLDKVKINEGTCFFALQCPEEGSFIAWKKCSNDSIVKLLIPEEAKRSSATTRKCRASKAQVLAIYDKEGKEIETTTSTYDINFIYKVGETVKPTEQFDDNRFNECGHGIHFFITRQEAENYN